MPNFCSVEGCDRPHRARGFCLMHYKRAIRRGEIELLHHPTICGMEGCERKCHARGLCSRHYQRRTLELDYEGEDLPGEEWRDIEEFNGLYQVSNKGRVRSLPHTRMRKYRSGDDFLYRVNGRILTPHKCAGGYLQVTLCNGERQKQLKIHRLVCRAFNGAPTGDRKEVNHLDGNKENNTPENLEWCTRRENNIHSKRVLKNGLIPVRCVETGEEFECMLDAEKEYGLKQGAISRIFRGVQKRANGLHFEKI